jgi:hypothetical protein
MNEKRYQKKRAEINRLLSVCKTPEEQIVLEGQRHKLVHKQVVWRGNKIEQARRGE